jgi:tetratricopeptide repeat protein
MKKRYLVIIAAILAVCSCGKREMTKQCLADVGRYISEKPDSALAVLESIDRASIRGQRMKAEYSLLYAMALDKNYIDTTDVSVVMPAVKYYDLHGPEDKAMKAWFYLGREQENGGEFEDAIISYTRAKELSLNSDDLRFRSLIASGIADLYGKTYNNVEKIANITESYNLAVQSGDKHDIWITIGELAVAYTESKQWDKADSLFQVFFNEISDSTYVSYYLPCYASIFVLRPELNPEKTLELLDYGINEFNIELSPYYCGMYAYACTLTDDHEKSKELLDQLETDDACDWKYNIYKENGDYECALNELESVLYEYDELMDNVLAQSISRAQRDYFELKTEMLEIDRNRQKVIKVTIGLISMLLLVLSLYIISCLVRRSHKMRDDMADIQAESESLKKELDRSVDVYAKDINSRDRIIYELRCSYIRTYRSQFNLLDELCSEYWSPAHNNDKRIYNKVKEVVSVIKDGSGQHSEFEAGINAGLYNIMLKLRTDFSKFNEDDFRLLSYVIVGFEAKTIATLMDITPGCVYTRKSRLKDRILSASTENVELYRICLR